MAKIVSCQNSAPIARPRGTRKPSAASLPPIQVRRPRSLHHHHLMTGPPRLRKSLLPFRSTPRPCTRRTRVCHQTRRNSTSSLTNTACAQISVQVQMKHKCRIRTNILRLTPPATIYVYELQMFRTVSSDNTIPSIMVHSAADKKSLVPVIKSREVRLDSSDNWVSDGDLIWSTTDIWGDLAQGKRRGSRAMHLDHRPGTCDLSYDNECGESLTIEHVDINYLQTIHTQQQHIGELLHIPTGTAFRRSTPDLLLRGLNAMLTAQARTSRTVTSKGGNKLFDTTAVQSLGKQVRALSGFFLSARPGADSLLLNINTAFSPFWDKITVHDYIKARSSSSDSQLVGALKGLQVNIRYDVSGGWRTPSSSRRFIVDVGRPINHQTCQDPAFQNMTVQDWYSQQRPHPLCPAPNVRLQLDDGERAIKVAKNTQENPADTEYFPASVLDIVEFQPLHGEMSGTQTAKMIKVARLSPEENRGKILNEGLPLFSLDQGNQGHLVSFPPSASILTWVPPLTIITVEVWPFEYRHRHADRSWLLS